MKHSMITFLFFSNVPPELLTSIHGLYNSAKVHNIEQVIISYFVSVFKLRDLERESIESIETNKVALRMS